MNPIPSINFNQTLYPFAHKECLAFWEKERNSLLATAEAAARLQWRISFCLNTDCTEFESLDHLIAAWNSLYPLSVHLRDVHHFFQAAALFEKQRNPTDTCLTLLNYTVTAFKDSIDTILMRADHELSSLAPPTYRPIPITYEHPFLCGFDTTLELPGEESQDDFVCVPSPSQSPEAYWEAHKKFIKFNLDQIVSMRARLFFLQNLMLIVPKELIPHEAYQKEVANLSTCLPLCASSIQSLTQLLSRFSKPSSGACAGIPSIDVGTNNIPLEKKIRSILSIYEENLSRCKEYINYLLAKH